VFQGGNDVDPLADADGIDRGAHGDDSTDTLGPSAAGRGGRTPWRPVISAGRRD
jgi:hypothetical protein